MRHKIAGRTLGRRPNQRRALLRGLATSLVEHGRIETTVEKAKELRRVAEPLITLAKKKTLHARRQAASLLLKKSAVQKLFGELAERFEGRHGGYTRIFRVRRRLGDGAEMALIEFLPPLKLKKEKAKPSKAKKKAAPTAKAKPKEEKTPAIKKTKKKARPRKSTKKTA